jgi:hypothetical protein
VTDGKVSGAVEVSAGMDVKALSKPPSVALDPWRLGQRSTQRQCRFG